MDGSTSSPDASPRSHVRSLDFFFELGSIAVNGNHLVDAKILFFLICQTVLSLAFFIDLPEKMGTNDLFFATGL